MTPIGQLKTKSKAYCTVCSSSTSRNLAVNVYENTPAKIEEAKKELALRAAKPYTCKVCASILKTNS